MVLRVDVFECTSPRFPKGKGGQRGRFRTHRVRGKGDVFSNIPPPLHLNDEREMTANFVTSCFFLGGGFV